SSCLLYFFLFDSPLGAAASPPAPLPLNLGLWILDFGLTPTLSSSSLSSSLSPSMPSPTVQRFAQPSPPPILRPAIGKQAANPLHPNSGKVESCSALKLSKCSSTAEAPNSYSI